MRRIKRRMRIIDNLGDGPAVPKSQTNEPGTTMKSNRPNRPPSRNVLLTVTGARRTMDFIQRGPSSANR